MYVLAAVSLARYGSCFLFCVSCILLGVVWQHCSECVVALLMIAVCPYAHVVWAFWAHCLVKLWLEWLCRNQKGRQLLRAQDQRQRPTIRACLLSCGGQLGVLPRKVDLVTS